MAHQRFRLGKHLCELAIEAARDLARELAGDAARRRRVARIAGTSGGEPPAPAAAAKSPTTEGACAGVVRPSANPAPMRLFHLSIAYLTLLFAVIAVTSLLPWGSW